MLALDTEACLAFLFEGARHHSAARAVVAREVERPDGEIVLTTGVLSEVAAVVLESASPAKQTASVDVGALLGSIRRARDVRVIGPTERTIDDLEDRLASVGGERPVSTAVLAGTLREHGVDRLATFDPGAYASYEFLQIVDPRMR